MAGPREFLFAYGTLRSDLAYRIARAAGKRAEFVGRAYFRGRLFDLGQYPAGLASPTPSDRVVWELHRIESWQEAEILAQLDRYEGCNTERPGESEFARMRAWIESEAGGRIEAWIYAYNHPTARLARIASGRYRRRDAS